jgi:hypothetical protein
MGLHHLTNLGHPHLPLPQRLADVVRLVKQPREGAIVIAAQVDQDHLIFSRVSQNHARTGLTSQNVFRFSATM